jgi:hypothetical protein
LIGLFDRDVFLKLGCCNLFGEAVDALGVTQPYRLAATSNAKGNARLVTKLYGEIDAADAVQRIQAMVADVPVLSEEMLEGIFASENFKLLGGLEDIDTGEQLLGALLLNQPAERIMISGDKRFIKAFRQHLPDQWIAHSESIISFEMCMIAIEDRYGFDYLVQRAAPAKHCDGTLRIAIQPEPSRDHFLECLASFNPCTAVIEQAQ